MTKKFSAYRNLETGETAPPHKIGTTEDGRLLYAYAEGYEPVEPYECDEDGNWIPSEATVDVDAAHGSTAQCELVIDFEDETVDLFVEDDEQDEPIEEVLTMAQFAALVKAIDKIPTKVRERILR